jgi:hypothetical protein
MKQNGYIQKRARAERVYAWFLRLYPGAYRRIFGQQMLQTFQDHYRDAIETEGESELRFWFGVAGDEGKSLVREHIAALREEVNYMKQWTFAATLGILLLGGMFACMVAYLTLAYPFGDWRILLIPSLLGGLFLFVKGASGWVTKLLTLAIALGIILFSSFFASRIDDWYDLMTPILILMGLFFYVKIFSGQESKQAAREKRVGCAQNSSAGQCLVWS